MPFGSVETLPPNPDVKIFLTGQLLLQPHSDNSHCDVGVNRLAINHHFSMEVRQKMVDQNTPDVIVWRHVGTLLSGGVRIALSSGSPGVFKFVPGSFSRSPTGGSDSQDFRWIIDLAGDEFHEGALDIQGPGAEPKIQIRNGVFYTASRTNPTEVTVKRKKGGKGDLDLHQIASMIGVNVYMGTGQKLDFTWFPGSASKTLSLDKPTGTSGIKNYEIWINNNPISVHPNDPPGQEELKEYYRVVNTVVVGGSPTAAFLRFELEMKPATELQPEFAPNLGTPRIPCMPVGLGK